VSPYYIVTIYAALGDTDEAFEWLERAVTTASVSCASLDDDSRLDSLRDDARFESQVSRCESNLAWDYTD
jgi:hypothetical protein